MANEKKNGNAFSEAFRRLMVGLKRRPFNIALVFHVITFLYYSINLTVISNTTAKIQGPNMGLYGFITMLISMLSIVTFMNAFQYRKPVNKPMLVLLFVMLGIVGFADFMYRSTILNAINRPDNPIVITQNTAYIAQAYNLLGTHLVMLVITVVLIVTLPVYSKLIRKVKTSIDVEGNGEMGAIDLSE